MQWTRPDFDEITLSGEVTAYVNTDEEVRASERPLGRSEPTPVLADQPPDASA